MRLAPEIGTSRGRRLVWVRVAQVGGGIAAAAARVSGWAGNRRLGGWREAESERSEDLSLALVLAAFGVCLRPPLRRALQKFWANTEPAHPLACRVFAHHGRTYCLLFKFSAIRKYLPSFYGSCLLACLPSVCARFIYKKYWPASQPPSPQPELTHTSVCVCACVCLSLACVCV
jgi:hypothetical protein